MIITSGYIEDMKITQEKLKKSAICRSQYLLDRSSICQDSLTLDTCLNLSSLESFIMFFFWNPSLLLQKKEFLLHFLYTFGFYNQAKSLAPTLKILFVFLCEAAVINYNNQGVVVELVTYLDLCKGASCVLGSAHQIG